MPGSGPPRRGRCPISPRVRRRLAGSSSTATRSIPSRRLRSSMMPIPLDYETLRVIWWLLLGILLIGFAIFDGFDLGTAILLPFAGRSDIERRLLINSVGPVWEGN